MQIRRKAFTELISVMLTILIQYLLLKKKKSSLAMFVSLID